MLTFVDQSTSIKVFRVVDGGDGHVSRQRLGVVRKKDFSCDDELMTLSDVEKSDISDVVKFYHDASKYETLNAVYGLPTSLRKVIEYIVANGTKLEREMVMMSLVEALRLMRKVEREQQ